MVLVVLDTTFSATKEISPEPTMPRPVAGLLFVQLYVVVELEPVNTTSTISPAQTIWFGGSSTVGVGLTLMVKVTNDPEINGLVEPLAKTLVSARSNRSIVHQVLLVLLFGSESQGPQSSDTLLLNAPVPVTLNHTLMVPV